MCANAGPLALHIHFGDQLSSFPPEISDLHAERLVYQHVGIAATRQSFEGFAIPNPGAHAAALV